MPQNYTIIGAGGTASHLIPALRRMLGDGDIVHIWDGDKVEEKNLVRQMFEAHEIGAPKARVYEDRYGQQFVAHMMYVGEDNIDRVLKNDDVVFICADNMAVRRIIADKAETLDDITIINGGNEMFTGSCQMYKRVGGQNLSPNITYHAPEMYNTDPDMASLSCAEIAELPGGEQTMLANMTVAALMLQAYWQADLVWLPHNTPDKMATKVTFDINKAYWQGSDVRMQGEDWR